MRKTVILSVLTSPNFPELLRVALLLEKSGSYKPLFYFSGPYPTIERDYDLCKKKGFDFVFFTGEGGLHQEFKESQIKLERSQKTLFKRIFAFYRRGIGLLVAGIRTLHNLIFSLSGPLGSYFEARDRLLVLYWFIKKIRPGLIIIADDKVRYDSLIFLKITKKIKVPIVNVLSVISHPREEAEVYKSNRKLVVKGIFNRLVALIFPGWVFKYKNTKVLRAKPYEILAMELLGIAPKTPWLDNNGDVNAIAVESRAMYKHYRRLGVRKSKMKLIGSIAEDYLMKNLRRDSESRKELYKALNLNPNHPIVVVALPTDMLYMPGGRPECDFKTYGEMVEFWVKTVASAKEYNIVVSLHPSDGIGKMKYIERWGVKISQKNAVELIPHCDLFVACVSSSIRWAIACGKPVLNYDTYRYGYHDYDGAKGVVRVEEQKDFRKQFRKLTEDKNYLADLTEKQKKHRRDWGMLDGKCGRRLMQLINRTVAGSL